MKRDGLENVHTEKVMVPHWVRGNESAEIVEPARHQIAMLGLGGSVGTPPDGIQAEVLIVHSFNELEAAGPRAKGQIVLFNVPYTGYEETVTYRVGRPVARGAARRGGVAGPVDRAARTAHAPHRRPAIHSGCAADSRRGDHHRGRRSAAAHGRPRHPRSWCG